MSQTREPTKAQPPTLGKIKNNHLPDDMVFNILARQPVKSLIRLRCVSKSCNSLITSPYFISTHLFSYNNNDHDNKDRGYILDMSCFNSPSPTNRPVIMFYCDHEFDKIFQFEVPLNLPSHHATFLVGSCNGLLCLNFCPPRTMINVIYVWNPNIRKLKRLPDPCESQSHLVSLGFGYQSKSIDYKVVKILRCFTSQLEVEVYSSKSDSWRRVGFSFRTNVEFEIHHNYYLPIPFFGGALHWLVDTIPDEENNKSEMILSFNVNNETFEELAPPDHCLDGEHPGRCLMLFRGKLALIRFVSVGEHKFTCICVIKEYGTHKSWNKPLVVPKKYDGFNGFTKCGLILSHEQFWMSSNGELKLRKKTKYVLIDPETFREKRVRIQNISFVATFMESLALLDGANVITY